MVVRDPDGSFLCLDQHEDTPVCCGDPQHVAIWRRVEPNDETPPRRLDMCGMDGVALELGNLIHKPERKCCSCSSPGQ
jgi:hypothetical protein